MVSKFFQQLIYGCLLLSFPLMIGCAMRQMPRITGMKPKAVLSAGLDPAGLETIDGICQKLVDENKTPGIVLLIGRGDDVLFRRAYGYRMKEPRIEPMTVDTLFDMASCTKATTTASAVMLLVQDGKIALDDPIAKHVPEFVDKKKDALTVLSLLTHCSGLPAYTNVQYLEEKNGARPNPDALIKRIAELPLQGKVGEKYVYSCLNYLVLARVVQNVCGENMSDFLNERLWTPLGMKDTTFYLNKEQISRTAPTIYAKSVLRRGMVHDPLAYYSVNEDYAPGNAGVFSTADDMSRYVRMILKGGSWGRRTIFERATWERITTNQSPATIDTKRSCGWGIWGENAYATPMNQTPETCVLGHTGYTGTLIWIDKLSTCYVIFLSNCVFPADKSETKDAVIQGRRRIISVLLDHLEMYREVRKPSSK